MNQTVTAIYSNGVLRPLETLDLPENSEVELDLRIVDKSQNKVRDLFIKNGLSIENTKEKKVNKLSVEERKRLAQLLSTNKELGKIISEDREER